MIHIKHFQAERTGKVPSWKVVEELLAKLADDQVISVTGYPTGMEHNLCIVYRDAIVDGKLVEFGAEKKV